MRTSNTLTWPSKRIAAPDTSGFVCLTHARLTACRSGEIITAIEHDIGYAHQFFQARALQTFLQSNYVNLRIDAQHGLLSRLRLGFADPLGAMHDLALQVGQVNGIVIGQRDLAYSGRRQIQCDRRTEPAGADNQRMRRQQPLLALDADLVQHNMARISQQLIVVHCFCPPLTEKGRIAAAAD